MQHADRPAVLLPLAILGWLLGGVIWRLLNPHVSGLALTRPVVLWYWGVLALWSLVLIGAMANYRSYSHIAAAQARLWLWVFAAAAPVLLYAAWFTLDKVFGHAA